MMLTGEQYQQLMDALVDAFPSPDELDQMVRFSFINKPLAVIAIGNSLPAIVFKLIMWTEARDKTEDLVIDARNVNPDNPMLRAFAEQFLLAPESGDLERIMIKSVAFANTEEWRAIMSKRELTVCRVEIPVDRGIGTGFLVNAGVLMTNYHVMKDVIEKRIEPEEVALRFDYKMTADRKTLRKGEVYRLAKDWLIDSSLNTKLDYVLLRVDGDPGAKPVGNHRRAPKRGWLTPEKHTFEKDEPLFIIQHPEAEPLKLASGFVKSLAENRVTYTVNTMPGSSGSPCFTSDWRLVALHHYGADSGNRAVIFSAILEQLEKNNLMAMLGNQNP